jgi:hypothetical protein
MNVTKFASYFQMKYTNCFNNNCHNILIHFYTYILIKLVENKKQIYSKRSVNVMLVTFISILRQFNAHILIK